MSSSQQPTPASPSTAADPLTVLVTGATGKTGRHLTRFLLSAGHRVRALTRHPLTAGLPNEVELHTGDPTRPETVAAAADGADAAFLVWMEFDATGVEKTVEALARNVDHVVYLSAAQLQDGRHGPNPGVWADVEAAVRASGVTWTFLRVGGFAANTLEWAAAIRAGEPVGIPYPEATRSSVHEADIAEVAWRSLVDPEHRRMAYDITGPQQLTQRQQAELIAEAIGKPVRIHHQSPDEARREASDLLGADYADAALRYWATLENSPERVSGDVARVIGRPARTFAEWASDHADDFRALDTTEVARRYADGFRSGDLEAAGAMLSPEVVRVAPLETEGQEVEVRGLAAIAENAAAQSEGVELLGVEVSEPMIGRDTFTIRFTFDERVVATGERQSTTKMSMCTVEAGRIVREEVFYYTPPTAAPRSVV